MRGTFYTGGTAPVTCAPLKETAGGEAATLHKLLNRPGPAAAGSWGHGRAWPGAGARSLIRVLGRNPPSALRVDGDGQCRGHRVVP